MRNELLPFEGLCDELIEIRHLVQLWQTCFEGLFDGRYQYLADTLCFDDFPFRETTVQESQFIDLFEKVLRKSQEWANDENMMYVVGATQGRAFEDIRKIVPNHFLLVPGIGAQGGSLEEVCKYGMNSTCGLIVNSSRAIIYADKTENFATVAGQEAQKVQAQMEKIMCQ